MATDFKLLEFELYGLLLKAKELLASLPGSGPMADKLDEELERIKTKKYNVAVVGEFRRGKSSLINALLGLPVLPADATPTTATVNRITYGAEPSVTIHYKDGSQKSWIAWRNSPIMLPSFPPSGRPWLKPFGKRWWNIPL